MSWHVRKDDKYDNKNISETLRHAILTTHSMVVNPGTHHTSAMIVNPGRLHTDAMVVKYQRLYYIIIKKETAN